MARSGEGELIALRLPDRTLANEAWTEINTPNLQSATCNGLGESL
jgi:hypothetical protein